MKKLTFAVMLLALAACKPTDEEIRADIASKAKDDLNFAGLYYTVHKGVLNVGGNCPSDEAFEKVRQKIKNIHVITAVNYKINITPVVLNNLVPTKLKVDSVLAKYPRVTANVSTKGVTLQGAVMAGKKQALITDLNKQHISVIKDDTSVY